MKHMRFKDACKALGLTGNVNEQTVKAAFRKMALEHHPDKGGTKFGMQVINAANEALQAHLEESGPSHIEIKDEHLNFVQEVNDAINAVIEHIPEEWGATIELIGSWAYLFGTKSPYVRVDGKSKRCPIIGPVIDAINAAGWSWNQKRGAWYVCPQEDKGAYWGKRKRKSTDELRETYGSTEVKRKRKRKISKAS